MKTVQIISYFVVGVVAISLAGCSYNKQKNFRTTLGDYGNGGLVIDGAESYALSHNSGYNAGQVRRNRNGEVINPMVAPANQTYYFDLDSNMIHQGNYKALELQANYLASHPKAAIRLEGNTDNRGSREYNIALGWRRDQAIERFLEQHGVLKSQIKEVSYGKERPAVLGNNEYAWRLNRRVKMTYEAN